MIVRFSLLEGVLCILQKRTTTPKILIYKLHTNECLFALSLLFNCPPQC